MRTLAALSALILSAASMTSANAQSVPPSAYPLVGRGDRYSGEQFASRAPVIATHGMAASEQPLASQVAIDILKKGGNAVDAAIAANAALGLIHPVGCGIGGDLFAIVWDPKTKRLYGINGSGRSPMGRTLADLKTKLGERTSIPSHGSLPVTVPGTVDAWFELHGKLGKLPMKEILAPAIGYARDGFPVPPWVAQQYAASYRAFDRNAAMIEEIANAKATYQVDGHAPKLGEIFKNPDLANTYEKLAKGGRDAFYKGGIAKTIDAYFKRIGGDMRYEDFANHKSEWVDPVSVNYRGYDIYGMPPNTQGAATLQIMKILEGFDVKAMGAGSADLTHLMVEAKRLVFEDVAKYYYDPAFNKPPVKWLLSADYAAERRKLIDMTRTNPNVGPGDARLSQGDTTYLTVADKDGMMVSLIQSNYRGMGSGLVADGLGFMFQDRGELFSLDPASANVYAPGKRPFHTIIPGFVMKDGKPWLSYGLMGGDMQPQGHAQVLVNLIDFGMNVQEAGDAARWYHAGGRQPTGVPYYGTEGVALEGGYAPEVVTELKRRGHTINQAYGGFGGYQAILRDPTTGVYWGATEMRKDGAAIGY